MNKEKSFVLESRALSATEVYRASVKLFDTIDGGEMLVSDNPCSVAVRLALKIRDEMICQGERIEQRKVLALNTSDELVRSVIDELTKTKLKEHTR